MSNRIHKIFAIDDHPIIHDGLKILFSTEPDLEIVEHASSAKEAMEKLLDCRPDLVIADLSLNDSDGTQLIRQMLTLYPKLKILVYSMSEERLFATRTASIGAHGYVAKTAPSKELKNAIYSILQGKRSFPPGILEHIESTACEHQWAHSVLDSLSNRQMDIFKLLGEGMNSAKIAKKLGISRNTVDAHRINIKNKLNLPNGKALERLAYETIKRR